MDVGNRLSHIRDIDIQHRNRFVRFTGYLSPFSLTFNSSLYTPESTPAPQSWSVRSILRGSQASAVVSRPQPVGPPCVRTDALCGYGCVSWVVSARHTTFRRMFPHL